MVLGAVVDEGGFEVVLGAKLNLELVVTVLLEVIVLYDVDEVEFPEEEPVLRVDEVEVSLEEVGSLV